jgi:vacuolar-type H+-ATPase subunit E/Vma4
VSLHAILEVIRSGGQAEIDEIEQRAFAQAREILANARLEAETIKEQARAAAEDPGFRERTRILHRARLEALQMVGNAREELVDSAIKQTRGRLDSLRMHSIYPRVLRKLLGEALDELQRAQVEDECLPAGTTTAAGSSVAAASLEADRRDRPLLERMLDEMGLEYPVQYNLQCWGGLVVKSADGRISVINTLEARLERATPYLRLSLAALFEQERGDSQTQEQLAQVEGSLMEQSSEVS